ncbi:MAG: NAD(P)-dependent oxidoreductase, partial [Bdellovibrionales bacterium]|nr:NAD(P)-dependent oxidoreductase [Bdellovibrionales bacterium]
MISLAYIGGMGLMASPAAIHLSNSSVAKVLSVHDRGTQSSRHEEARAAWITHGAQMYRTLSDTITAQPVDGVVICCGKNGDDLPLLSEVCRKLRPRGEQAPFILHLSTVSANFVRAAHQYCNRFNIDYANYPLTGGPLGAQAGGASDKGMLILASGNGALYHRLLPFLSVIGKPKYFGADVTKGTESKLIGHFLVYNGLLGISSALALHSEGFSQPLGSNNQVEYFDFLIQGAGGTRQWEIAARKGIANGIWDQGFLIPHAVVDALYAAQLCISRKLPRIILQP